MMEGGWHIAHGERVAWRFGPRRAQAAAHLLAASAFLGVASTPVTMGRLDSIVALHLVRVMEAEKAKAGINAVFEQALAEAALAPRLYRIPGRR